MQILFLVLSLTTYDIETFAFLKRMAPEFLAAISFYLCLRLVNSSLFFFL